MQMIVLQSQIIQRCVGVNFFCYDKTYLTMSLLLEKLRMKQVLCASGKYSCPFSKIGIEVKL